MTTDPSTTTAAADLSDVVTTLRTLARPNFQGG